MNIPDADMGHYTLNGESVSAGFNAVAGTSATVVFVPDEGVVVKEGADSEWTFWFTKEKCVVPPTDEPKRPTKVDTDDGAVTSQSDWLVRLGSVTLLGALVAFVAYRRKFA